MTRIHHGRIRGDVGVGCALVAALCTAGAPAQPLIGTIEQHAFVGPVTQQPVLFNIYLPEGYASGTERYPVIYHLHGLGGSQGGPQNTTVAASFEAALAANIIGPVIIVFPNGYTDSWWADSIGGDKPAETDVVAQLIPHVDANFRTIPTRGARVVEGFSMGGFGATKFFSKFPGLFVACVEYDGALVTWQNMLQFHAALAASIFGNSQAYFDQYSPWHWTTLNATVLHDGSGVRMVVGALVPGNRNFRDHLLALDIPVGYVETACGHVLGCLLDAEGLNSAAYIAGALDLCGACYANCDCSTGAPALTVADFVCYQAKFVAGDPYADCNGDSSLTVADFGCFQAEFAAGCP